MINMQGSIKCFALTVLLATATAQDRWFGNPPDDPGNLHGSRFYGPYAYVDNSEGSPLITGQARKFEFHSTESGTVIHLLVYESKRPPIDYVIRRVTSVVCSRGVNSVSVNFRVEANDRFGFAISDNSFVPMRHWDDVGYYSSEAIRNLDIRDGSSIKFEATRLSEKMFPLRLQVSTGGPPPPVPPPTPPPRTPPPSTPPPATRATPPPSDQCPSAVVCPPGPPGPPGSPGTNLPRKKRSTAEEIGVKVESPEAKSMIESRLQECRQSVEMLEIWLSVLTVTGLAFPVLTGFLFCWYKRKERNLLVQAKGVPQ